VWRVECYGGGRGEGPLSDGALRIRCDEVTV